jgi:hypothetical protein
MIDIHHYAADTAAILRGSVDQVLEALECGTAIQAASQRIASRKVSKLLVLAFYFSPRL